MPSPISTRKRRLIKAKTVLFPNEQREQMSKKRLEELIKKKNML